jgi:cytochrome c oxidase assembly protein subunit 15
MVSSVLGPAGGRRFPRRVCLAVVEKKDPARMVRPLIILFLLGALQGAVGWIMVLSGLTGDATYVQPTKLALHFVFALVLIVYTFWLGLELSVAAKEPGRVRPAGQTRTPGPAGPPSAGGRSPFCATFLPVMYGALMAGHKAANTAPTWPTINGDWVPPGLFITGHCLKRWPAIRSPFSSSIVRWPTACCSWC